MAESNQVSENIKTSSGAVMNQPGNIPVLPSFHNIKVDIQKPAEPKTSFEEEKSQISNVDTDINAIKAAIQTYGLEMKTQGRMFEFALFNDREVGLQNGKLIFKLENELQKSQLFEKKADFIDFLREKFRFNFAIEAEILKASETVKNLLYTPSDKYKFMVEKYPLLDELKKRLGLELEH
ncbi:MAG: hypothetical protein ACKVOU_12385 [Cytophagales bacterium]